jgi:hypothetical protein
MAEGFAVFGPDGDRPEGKPSYRVGCPFSGLSRFHQAMAPSWGKLMFSRYTPQVYIVLALAVGMLVYAAVERLMG